MAKVRKDNKGRNLRPGETQRADGSYTQQAAFMLDIMLVHYPSVFVYRTPAYMMKFIL